MRKYFRAAFLYPWNMLAFFGGLGLAALSPWPDAAIPVALGLELAYLTGLTAIPRFRLAIDAKLAAQARGAMESSRGATLSPDAQLHQMLSMLPQESLRRFLLLRQRCTEMRDIASGVMGRAASNNDSAESIRTPSLDRLLFLFLKLLVSQAGLDRFLKSTSEAELATRLKDVQTRLVAAQAAKDERIVTSLKDSLADAQLRVDNYAKSKSDGDFVVVELDRIETKIQALIEMGVSRQDPNSFSTEVTAAADSMAQTEEAVKQLQSLSGLSDQMQDPPAILSADLGPRVLNVR
ncbi:MAG: hypothetical protein ABJB66_16905 [Gemmatimonadaceae bacterium]